MNTCSCGKPAKTLSGLQAHQRLTGHTGPNQSPTSPALVPGLAPAPVTTGGATSPEPATLLVGQPAPVPAPVPVPTSTAPTGEVAALHQYIEHRFDQLLEGLADQSGAPMCQDPNCPACASDDFHQAYQKGGADMLAWYEGIPGVGKLREHAQLMRTKIQIKA